jgi:recombination protein RecA
MAKKSKKPVAVATIRTPEDGSRSTLADFDAKFSNGIVDVRKMTRAAGYRTTGSIKLDGLLRGGFPKGTMVELWGPPQSGKSTVAVKAAGECLKEGGRVAYVDLERGLDLINEADWLEAHESEVLDELQNLDDSDLKAGNKKRTSWLRTNGVDVFDPNFRILDPQHGEHMFAMLAEIVKHNLFDLVIVDSVAAIITAAEMKGEPGESHFGQVAKLLTIELKRLLRLYGEYHNSNTTILFINQARDKIGYMAKGQKSTGGHALEHYVGTKVRFTKIKREETDDDVITESTVKIDKSRYASARTVHIFVSGQRGLDVLKEVFDFGVDFGYIHQSGSWCYIYEEPVDPDDFKAAKDKASLPGFATKKQGEDKALNWLVENGWQDRLTALAKKALGE